MKYNITDCKTLVTKVLKEYSDTRDSDEKLIARIWLSECTLLKLNYEKVLEHIFYNKLTSSKSIVRVRALLQNKHPELRGAKWEKRHKKLVEETKDSIKKFKNE